MVMKKRRRNNKWSILAVKFFVAIFLLQIFTVVLLRWVPVYITPLVIIRGVEKLKSNEQVGFYKTWKSWDNISEHVKVSVLCAEDQNFLKHYGFDLGAIEKAIDYNKKQEARGGNRRRGASTISQQTAKNVFLWPGRSWVRKGLEVYYTFLIETFWGKKRILEVYLNVVELGNGVYGAEAAANQYWKTSAAKLSREQAALIASVLPSPRKYSAVRPGPYIQKRKNWTLQQMRYNQTFYDWVRDK